MPTHNLADCQLIQAFLWQATEGSIPPIRLYVLSPPVCHHSVEHDFIFRMPGPLCPSPDAIPKSVISERMLTLPFASCRPIERLKAPSGSRFRFCVVGGDDRIRTGDGGFADPCLTTWLRRLEERCWCRGGDLNPYARRHGPLKTACLPIPPPRLLGPENPRLPTLPPSTTSTLRPRVCRSTTSAETRLAGVEGLEPPTGGFGDRCSSN